MGSLCSPIIHTFFPKKKCRAMIHVERSSNFLVNNYNANVTINLCITKIVYDKNVILDVVMADKSLMKKMYGWFVTGVSTETTIPSLVQ